MELIIENMTCGGCAKSVTKAIQSVDPNAVIETNPEARTVRVETAASTVVVQKVLEDAGYPATAN
ncbi:heavy-metal-associated domain-containing protein [Rhizobium sp. Root1204]|uniref:heavy-metal-associated domain-containing protein n=1 Tax=Rhizobium sp. Root1204 TaxID=1736428 RepID=UPI000715D932|nr:heavy-metal-associated domain-containing protein [Rhizobium sp. Root1204]KQV38607.1 heavy metal transport/detoxification protein [Rhizobium sp. Root1204]